MNVVAAGPGGGTVASSGDVNLTLVVVAAGLIGCGVYLLLERSLSRVLVGLVMMGNGISLGFLVAGGPAGVAPIVEGESGTYVDPLPQAMVLTAIVIMLATVSFVLAMAYRSWQLAGHDDVQDDVEDALIRRMAAQDIESDSFRAETTEDDEETDLASDFTVAELAEAKEAAERVEAERRRSEQPHSTTDRPGDEEDTK
ncbi:Na(+)/H(+) antiporter subunit C [Nocardioides jishulii]|uniref:Na(+)/H(+) antiporter subunit C n=1 Tax=Nocardioides jishulii TaxID=2575440 RepID=A0A4U2YQY9_9ACTN|nr:Na(+)/H(+) antiporter subunit C [Nocardioides jishulii]QCX26340.1 Na(+)/H(+) antiporter subunit C [Nocardioides jishulii]TKI63856.1 Na(+)/H(+) antiporter subunit C [Nocardioides jishulii]